MYAVEQLADDKEHAGGLKTPPAPPSLHNMEPVGVVGELDVSATVTVRVTGVPGLPAEELGETVLVVESCVVEVVVLLVVVLLVVVLLEIAVLLLLVNTNELSAIAGRVVKLPKSNKKTLTIVRKSLGEHLALKIMPTSHHSTSGIK